MTILVISASVGAGHVRAAEALVEAAAVERPGVEVVHRDILSFTSPLYRKAYAGSYLQLVARNPALWGYLYATFDRARVREQQSKVVRMFDRLQFARFRAELRELAPAAVIATHFLPCQVLAPYRERGGHAFPLGLVLTDFDAHLLWVQPTADRVFVGTDELAARFAGKGIAPAAIEVTGIPVGRAFVRRPARARVRAALGIDAAAPVVLVMGGGRGAGAVDDAVDAALAHPGAVVLAVAGRNARLEQQLRARAAAA